MFSMMMPISIREFRSEKFFLVCILIIRSLLLKELLENRSAELNANGVGEFVVSQPYELMRQAKTKKVVDTKASKGRKLRYTVHEKLQNFMAPEDKNAWGERQRDELFSSLFGRTKLTAMIIWIGTDGKRK